MRYLFLIFALAVLPLFSAAAIAPQEMLDDPVLEQRARELGKELRCPVCQNQSLDDSEAEIAQDLRRIVRERLVAGDTDAEVKSYLVARYGDYVLLEPPMKPKTWALWFGPALVVVIGGVAVWQIARRNRQRLAEYPESDADWADDPQANS
ncbi:MAG TPA: cytochrome c-type biogenesis protein [Alphaproteobacteria bacterium]|nr:cytochrome c-type biogenesis protein [Alphaproteobacteria bacterium]